jgi:hypothetical protein
MGSSTWRKLRTALATSYGMQDSLNVLRENLRVVDQYFSSNKKRKLLLTFGHSFSMMLYTTVSRMVPLLL